MCIAMRLGRAASVEVALIRDALCRSTLEIRYTQQGSMYDVWAWPHLASTACQTKYGFT